MSKMNAGKVFAIIPIFNRLQMTLQCIRNLKGQDYSNQITIVVVDGGSTDCSVDAVSAEYPDVRLYSGFGELWWTDAVALAIEKIMPEMMEEDYFFLVNNDTILPPDALSKLVKSSMKNGRAVIAATVREKSGHMVAAGARMRWGLILGNPVGIDDVAVREGDVLPVDVVFGRATLVPTRCIAVAGNFDSKRFPQYYGDSDFFLRVSRTDIPVLVDFGIVVSCYEDESNTGIHYVKSRPITIIEAWSMLTSKRSNLNLPDGWRFICLHAPSRRKLLCLTILTFINIKIVSVTYLHKYWLFKQLLRFRALATKKTSTFIQLYRMTTYFELKVMGVNIQRELHIGAILKSGIPHVYLIRVPFLTDVNRRATCLSFMLRHANIFRILRMMYFVRRWNEKLMCGKKLECHG